MVVEQCTLIQSSMDCIQLLCGTGWKWWKTKKKDSKIYDGAVGRKKDSKTDVRMVCRLID